MREHRRANICSCSAVQHLCLCAHESDGDALRHGVDEARECILREGEAASLETSCVSDKALDIVVIVIVIVIVNYYCYCFYYSYSYYYYYCDKKF